MYSIKRVFHLFINWANLMPALRGVMAGFRLLTGVRACYQWMKGTIGFLRECVAFQRKQARHSRAPLKLAIDAFQLRQVTHGERSCVKTCVTHDRAPHHSQMSNGKKIRRNSDQTALHKGGRTRMENIKRRCEHITVHSRLTALSRPIQLLLISALNSNRAKIVCISHMSKCTSPVLPC